MKSIKKNNIMKGVDMWKIKWQKIIVIILSLLVVIGASCVITNTYVAHKMDRLIIEAGGESSILDTKNIYIWPFERVNFNDIAPENFLLLRGFHLNDTSTISDIKYIDISDGSGERMILSSNGESFTKFWMTSNLKDELIIIENNNNQKIKIWKMDNYTDSSKTIKPFEIIDPFFYKK